MSDRWTEKLSPYLDGELSAVEREQLESHLAKCEECAAALEQLRRVVGRARALEDRPPATGLWSGIAERIGAAPSDAKVADLEARRRSKVARLRQRRLSFSLPQLAAASIALIVISAGGAWLVSRPAGPAAERGASSVSGQAGLVSAPVAGHSATSYDAAIVELERIIDESRDQLDTTTVRVIEENLMIINQAIVQAQRALAEDPASEYLNEHLAATMRQKLEFLRRAAEMTRAVS
ncbi:MAG: zf-HC2 domain-containing protein [Gemmatimonadota bacterium]|nr:MAG: zf-HC2 domain-containing protein [Gemmatimonadota bacterium]